MPRQAGNVLFLILIAVALFAALAYAVTSSSRSGGSSTSKEKATANAAAIIQFGTALRNSIMRVKISNGCTDTTLDLASAGYLRNSGSLGSNTNINAPSDKRCHIFDPAGGNMVAWKPPASSLDFNNPDIASPTALRTGHGSIVVYQVKGIGTDDPASSDLSNDLFFRIPYLKKETCLAINDLLNVENSSNEAPSGVVTGSMGFYPNGSFASTAILDNASTNTHAAFCNVNSSGIYIFYQALLER